MTTRQNCWEIKKCGREPGGNKTDELGVCPASLNASYDSINGGKNGGRICWKVVGTFCGGNIQGFFAKKTTSCMSCNVFRQVREEEGVDNFDLLASDSIKA